MAVAANSTATATLPGILTEARQAQRQWSGVPVHQRLKYIRRLRHLIAERADEFAACVARSAAETLVSEVLPLAAACRFLEQNAESLLAPRRADDNRPLWLRSVELTIYREPLGVVLVIGPANYPLFLPGVQVIQALAAGNAVLLKPGHRGFAAAAMLLAAVHDAGFPPGVVAVLNETPESAQAAIECSVDKVLITGSKQTGQAVLEAAASRITPVIAELSGWDPVFVLPDADLHLAAAALRFGVQFNGGNTCIRPRTVFGEETTVSGLRALLGTSATELDLVPVASDADALRRADECEYALGATVFGSRKRAEEFATKVRAGVVVINDMIAPTAHPAVPFGGRRASGFGVTRGAEGLLELTVTKAVLTQRSRWLPHLEPAQQEDRKVFSAFIRAAHSGTMRGRVRACVELCRALVNRRKEI